SADSGESGLHLIFFGHVANVAAAGAAGRFDLTQGFRHVAFVQIDNGQTRALAGQIDGHSTTQTLACAGNSNNFLVPMRGKSPEGCEAEVGTKRGDYRECRPDWPCLD